MDKKTLERIIDKIDTNGPIIEGMSECCFKWTGSLDEKGRPRFFHNGNGGLARRALFEAIIENALLDDIRVMAICRNRKCMNPAHLFAATRHDARALERYPNFSPEGASRLKEWAHETGISPNEIAVSLRVGIPLIHRVLFASGHTSIEDLIINRKSSDQRS